MVFKFMSTNIRESAIKRVCLACNFLNQEYEMTVVKRILRRANASFLAPNHSYTDHKFKYILWLERVLARRAVKKQGTNLFQGGTEKRNPLHDNCLNCGKKYV
jgi:hypothetical protein